MKEKIQFSDLMEHDSKAIQRLYENNFPLILRFITLNTGSMDEAREIFHDSVFVLIQRIREKQIDASADLTLYIYSIARILWMDLLREKLMDESNIRHIHEFLDLDASKIRSRFVGVKNLSNQLKILAEPGRTILREHVAHDVSLAEIAQRMGFSSEDSAVKGKVKALQKLLETS